MARLDIVLKTRHRLVVREGGRVRMMKMVHAREADQQQVEHFLMNNEAINGEQLMKKGFVVQVDNSIKGCFVIERIDQETYWLRQLYMNKEEVISLPLIMDSIIVQAREDNIKRIFVHSHQQVVDELLSTLEFYPQTAPLQVHEGVIQKGKWWAYAINS